MVMRFPLYITLQMLDPVIISRLPAKSKAKGPVYFKKSRAKASSQPFEICIERILECAVRSGNVKLVRTLLDPPFNINVNMKLVSKQQKSALHLAVALRDLEMIKVPPNNLQIYFFFLLIS